MRHGIMIGLIGHVIYMQFIVIVEFFYDFIELGFYYP